MNKNQKFFYGWVIAIASGIGLASCVAIFIPSTIGLVVGPFSKEFGWSAQQIFLAPVFATMATILVASFVGGLVERFGARFVIVTSFVAEALIMASFYFLDNSISLFYARYAAFAILATGTCHVAYTTVISRWFDRNRGLALGIALAGFCLGGVFWSLVAQALFDRFGWREAYLYMAAIITFITLPIMFVTMRNTPESMGTTVDCDPDRFDAGGHKILKPEVTGMSLWEVIKTSRYWMMIITFGLVGFGVQSIMLHMVPFLRGRGESAQTAAAVQASLWAVLVVGRVSTGWLMDRFFAPRVAFGFLLLPIIGIGLLASGASGGVALIAAMMVGLAAGAEVDVVAYLTSRYFGLRHYALIYSTFFTAFAVGSGAGPAWTAWAVTHMGGYGPVLWIISGVLGVAAALLLFFPQYRKTSLAH